MSQCPHCGATEDQTTYGRTARGSQRYKCRACQRVYTPEPLPLGYADGVKSEAVRLYLEGTNFRRIRRILGVNRPCTNIQRLLHNLRSSIHPT